MAAHGFQRPADQEGYVLRTRFLQSRDAGRLPPPGGARECAYADIHAGSQAEGRGGAAADGGAMHDHRLPQYRGRTAVSRDGLYDAHQGVLDAYGLGDASVLACAGFDEHYVPPAEGLALCVVTISQVGVVGRSRYSVPFTKMLPNLWITPIAVTPVPPIPPRGAVKPEARKTRQAISRWRQRLAGILIQVFLRQASVVFVVIDADAQAAHLGPGLGRTLQRTQFAVKRLKELVGGCLYSWARSL